MDIDSITKALDHIESNTNRLNLIETTQEHEPYPENTRERLLWNDGYRVALTEQALGDWGGEIKIKQEVKNGK